MDRPSDFPDLAPFDNFIGVLKRSSVTKKSEKYFSAGKAHLFLNMRSCTGFHCIFWRNGKYRYSFYMAF